MNWPAIVLLTLALFLVVATVWTLYIFRNLFRFGFARYGGCTLPLLELCHPHTVALRNQAGMLLFGVVSISSLIAGLSWGQITRNPFVGVGFCATCFVLFSLLDRSLMSSLDGASEPLRLQNETVFQRIKRLSLAWGKTFAAYATRIVIVVLTAHVSTTVVQGFVFAPEIEVVIAKRAAELVEPAIKKLDDANRKYGEMVTGWEAHILQEKNVLQQFVDAGNTVRANELRETISRKEADFAQIRAGGVEFRARKSAELELSQARARASEPVGQADRDKILQELAESNMIIKYLYWMIFTIELAAFIAKVLRGKDEYDYLVTSYKNFSKGVRYTSPEELPPNVATFHRV